MKQVIKEIIPSKKERQEANKLINTFLKKIKIKDASVSLGGSYAKDTWLSGNYDIDIYVAFNYDKNKNISSILEKQLKKKFKKINKVQGSRAYFQIKHGKFLFEIIPIIKIKKVDDAKNITDISPFHVKWVKKHKKGNEIRLAKAFFKAINCYGAESYLRGFSGYVIEILTICYGSFNDLIKKASKWKHKEYIDIEKHGVKLNKSKTISPLTIVDPVQNDRNAAAALSRGKYNLFIEAARQYLKNSSPEFFRKKHLKISEIKKKFKGKIIIILKAKTPKGRKDIVGCRILKTFTYLKKQLLSHDFEIIDNGWEWEKNPVFWYILPKKQLSEYRLHTGPKLSFAAHVVKFKEKHKKHKLLTKNGRIYSKIPRKHKKANLFVKWLINNDKTLKKHLKKLEIQK